MNVENQFSKDLIDMLRKGAAGPELRSWIYLLEEMDVITKLL